MPSLHELFDAATDGMQPLPDLAPTTRRIARRKQLAARTTAAMLSCALVIGAGTVALTAHTGTVRTEVTSSPQAFSLQSVVDTLRTVWPNRDQQLGIYRDRLGNQVITVSKDGKTVALIYFEVMADVDRFPKELTCLSNAFPSCIEGNSTDGDKVLASHSSTGGLHAQILLNEEFRGYRLHGTYLGQLTISANSNNPQLMPDQQLLEIMESPAYEQLIESAVAASSLSWFGTPPPTSSSGSVSSTPSSVPSPSTSGN